MPSSRSATRWITRQSLASATSLSPADPCRTMASPQLRKSMACTCASMAFACSTTRPCWCSGSRLWPVAATCPASQLVVMSGGPFDTQ
eukprot:9661475-Prorocentrum_lima.AAC.1